MKLFASTLLSLLLSTSAYATSMYNGLVLGKKVGENTCSIFPYAIYVVINGQTSEIGFANTADEARVASGEVDTLIQIARTKGVTIIKHVAETIPNVIYTATEAAVTSESLVLYEAAGQTTKVNGKEATLLKMLIDRNCPDLNPEF